LTTHEVLAAKDTLLSSLASRFNYILAGDQRNLFMAITFLDYRFKNFDFVSDVQVINEFKEAVKTFLYDHYRTHISTESEVLTEQRCPQRPIRSNRLIFQFFDKSGSKETSTQQQQFDDEWNKYKNFYLNELYADPLEFYRNNQKLFRIFTSMVRYFYCIVGSSVPSECLLSHSLHVLLLIL